jgi:hypothetical protein
MEIDGAPAVQIQLIEPVDVLSRSVFVDCCVEHGESLGWVTHSARSIDPRGDPEGNISRIRLSGIGACDLQQFTEAAVQARTQAFPQIDQFWGLVAGGKLCTESTNSLG